MQNRRIGSAVASVLPGSAVSVFAIITVFVINTLPTAARQETQPWARQSEIEILRVQFKALQERLDKLEA